MASPLLMLPLVNEDSEEIHGLSLYNLKDKQPHNLKFLENLKNLRCVGSSHGWLAFADKNQNPLLLNPFTNSQIHLPPNQTISKLILSKNPSSHPTTFAAVAMYDLHLDTTKLAFWRNGAATWRRPSSQGETYYDIICCPKTNTLYALAPGPCVESWDLNLTVPKKKIIIKGSCPRSLHLARETFPPDLYASQWYVALAPPPIREVLMVVRYIGEFVRHDGEVVTEGDTLTDYSPAPVVCPYRTVGFQVFRVCGGKEWVDVDSLGDLALFLGGNESAAVVAAEREGVRRNAIYFSDDYWERIDEDYSYGGHDFGVFCMGDGTIDELFDFQRDRIEPPPFWITLPRGDDDH